MFDAATIIGDHPLVIRNRDECIESELKLHRLHNFFFRRSYTIKDSLNKHSRSVSTFDTAIIIGDHLIHPSHPTDQVALHYF